jgi:hypothetical protein
LLGELNRLRDPKTDDRDDPSNLLDNTSGGKQILNRFKAAGSSGDRWLFRLATEKESGNFKDALGDFSGGALVLG